MPIFTWLLVFSCINYSILWDENIKGFVSTEMPMGLKLLIDLRLFLLVNFFSLLSFHGEEHATS